MALCLSLAPLSSERSFGAESPGARVTSVARLPVSSARYLPAPVLGTRPGSPSTKTSRETGPWIGLAGAWQGGWGAAMESLARMGSNPVGALG